MSSEKIRVGFDLDGVIIGKPFFVPDFLMERLVRIKVDHRLAYRFPKSALERFIRYLSHYPLLRPPIKKNINLIKELYKSKEYELFVVSSRYSFLDSRTEEWFKFYKMNNFFERIFINLKNEQPHVYKEKMIRKLKLNVFIDDDKLLLEYLGKKINNVNLIYVTSNKGHLQIK